jgi:uncharacterized membrane protein HdeD (DUF308 family)
MGRTQGTSRSLKPKLLAQTNCYSALIVHRQAESAPSPGARKSRFVSWLRRVEKHHEGAFKMSVAQPSFYSGALPALRKSIHDHWHVFLAEGIALIVLGFAAIFVPPIAGIVTTVVLGWVFLLAGFAGLVSVFAARRTPGFGWALLSSLAAVCAGGVLLWNPMQGLITLTLVLTAFFVVDGLLMIALGLSHRRELSGKWEWMMVNGVIDLLLAGIIVLGLPGTFAWALGLLVGIDLVFGGASLVTMALDARKASFLVGNSANPTTSSNR